MVTILSFNHAGCTISHPVSQGLRGKVLWFEGDLMPGINKEPVEGIPVKREIYVFQPTRSSQTEVHNGVFYQGIQTDLVKKLWTDEKGNFLIYLPPGRYSVFTKESFGFYANRLSEEGFLNLVNIITSEVTVIEIRVDYEAAY